MTIESVYLPEVYAGNDVADTFAYGFKISAEEEMIVTEVDDATDAETVLILDTDYTVTGVGEDDGGDVVLTDPLATGKTLVLSRTTSATQSTNFENQGGFFANTHEAAFDKITQLLQEHAEQLERCPKTTIQSGDTGEELIANVTAAVAAAAASAAAATTAETNAETAETNAETAATNAAASAAAAAQSAIDAAASAGAFSDSTIAIKTDNYTVLSSDAGKTLVMNAGTAKAFTLPAVSGMSGKVLILSDIGAGTCTITPNGADTCDVASLLTGEGVILVGDSSNTKWRAIAMFKSGILGSTPVTLTGVQTFTNKRNTPRVGTTTSSATPTINTDSYDIYTITALAAAITSFTTNLSGTPTAGQKLIIRIKDDGTARAITWGASFASRGVTLPTTTVAGKYLRVGLEWNEVASVWDCIASAQEA